MQYGADGAHSVHETRGHGCGVRSAGVLSGGTGDERVGAEQRNDPPDDTTMRIEGGRLVGRLGNDEDGYTDFRLDRRR